MDPEAALKIVHKYTQDEFHTLWTSVREFLLIETLDNKGQSQGCAVVEMLQAYKDDQDGAFGTVRYIGCSDEYYAYWVDNDMPRGVHHHFCRSSSLRSCRSKVGSDGIIHVLKWVPLTKSEAEHILREWGLPLGFLSRRARPKVPPVPALSDGRGKPASKSAPATLPRTLDRGSPDREDRRDRGRDRERGRRRSEHDEEGSPHDPRSRRSHMAMPVTPPREPPPPREKAAKKRKPEEAALDAMLEEEPEDADSDKLGKMTDERLTSLKEALATKKSAAKSSKEPGVILASRAAAIAETSHKKKKKSSDTAVKVVRKLIGDKKHVKEEVDYGDEISDGTDSSSEDSDNEDDGLGSGLGGKSSAAGKQRKLRQFSEKKPGRLLAAGFRMMHDQVGTHYGGTSNKQEALSPVMVRYLLSFAMPQFRGGISQDKYRELRTIATSVDLMIEGKTGQAGDVLVQRFKSLLMGIRDGTDTASKWLELLPHDVVASMASSSEDYLARSMAVQEAKSNDLLRRASGAAS